MAAESVRKSGDEKARYGVRRLSQQTLRLHSACANCDHAQRGWALASCAENLGLGQKQPEVVLDVQQEFLQQHGLVLEDQSAHSQISLEIPQENLEALKIQDFRLRDGSAGNQRERLPETRQLQARESGQTWRRHRSPGRFRPKSVRVPEAKAAAVRSELRRQSWGGGQPRAFQQSLQRLWEGGAKGHLQVLARDGERHSMGVHQSVLAPYVSQRSARARA